MEICVLLCWFSGIFAMLGMLLVLWLDVMDAFLDQSFVAEPEANRMESVAAVLMANELGPEVRAILDVIQICYDCGCTGKELSEVHEELYQKWLIWSRYRDIAKPLVIVSY